MFNVHENGSVSYRGVLLDATNDPEAENYIGANSCYRIPQEFLREIDARDIPDIEYDDVYYLLPRAKGIVSSKCPHYIQVKEVNENGVILHLFLFTNEIHWNEPISPVMFFSEVQALFDNNDRLELHHSYIAPSEFDFTLEYLLEVPSFNLKDIYDTANNLLIKVEEEVYEKILQVAIGNLEEARNNYNS